MKKYRNLFVASFLTLSLSGFAFNKTLKVESFTNVGYAILNTDSIQVNVIPLPYKISSNTKNEYLRLPGLVGINAPKEMEPYLDAFTQEMAKDGLPIFNKSSKGKIHIKIDANSKSSRELVPKSVGSIPSMAMEDERYDLQINKKGIWITSPTVLGAYRGLTTLRQLILQSNTTQQDKLVLQTLKIYDGPKLGWRGFKLDIARNYYDVQTIKQLIDQLSMYKYNVLTLHLTDNEAWRVEIKSHPRLTEFTKEYYTQSQLEQIVKYANDRGIVVIPEIDFPGHSAALLKVYPNLGEFQQIAGKQVAFIKPDSKEFWTIFSDVAKELKDITKSEFLHFGGDEAFGMPDSSYKEFIKGALQRIHSLDITPIGYQESTRAGVTKSDYIQIWADFADPGGDLEKWEELVKQGKELPQGLPKQALAFYQKAALDLNQALNQKASIIASPTKRAYFDTPYAESSLNQAQQRDKQTLGMTLYTPLTLEQFYNWEPENMLYGLDLKNLSGVEAALWSDTIKDDNTLWRLILARIPGFAERSWSQSKGLNWQDYKQRLSYQSIFWNQRNLEWFESELVDWKTQ